MLHYTSGLYYKHMTIVNYTSSVVNKLEALLTDDTRVVIQGHHVFISKGHRLESYGENEML